MKRLSLLSFFGVMASVLAGCPIFSGDDLGPINCVDDRCATGTTTTYGCYSPRDCGQNETCGADGQCHSGDCTFSWGCVSGYTCVVDPETQTASCESTGTTGTTGPGGAGGSGTGGAATGGAGTGGAATGGAGTGGAATGGAGTGGAATGGAGGAPPAGTCQNDGVQDTCAAGSICLHKQCWDACDPTNPSECLGMTLDICTDASTDGVTIYNVCGQSPPGTECDPHDAALGCPNGGVCIGGYCE